MSTRPHSAGMTEAGVAVPVTSVEGRLHEQQSPARRGLRLFPPRPSWGSDVSAGGREQSRSRARHGVGVLAGPVGATGAWADGSLAESVFPPPADLVEREVERIGVLANHQLVGPGRRPEGPALSR